MQVRCTRASFQNELPASDVGLYWNAMGRWQSNKLILLAVMVAMAAVRPVWLFPHAHGDDAPHLHDVGVTHHHDEHDHHDHGDPGHGHHHHHGHDHGHGQNDTHHQGEDTDLPDHDHGIVEHTDDSPKARWIGPRTAPTDPMPVAVFLPDTHGQPPLPNDFLQTRQGRPPSCTGPPGHFTTLKTIILRL